MTLIVFLGKAKQQCYERQSLNCQFISTEVEKLCIRLVKPNRQQKYLQGKN